MLVFWLLITGLEIPEIEQTIQQGDWQKAQNQAIQVLEKDPNLTDAYWYLVKLPHASRDLAEALKWAEKGLVHVKQNALYYLELARLTSARLNENKMLWMGGSSKYLGYLDQAIQIDPDLYAAYHEKIGFLCQAPGMVGGDKKQALALAESLTQRQADQGYKAQVTVYNAMEQPEKAKAILEQWIEQSPSGPAYYEMGMLMQSQKDYPAALSWLERAWEKGFRPALYQAARTRILGQFEADKAIANLQTYLEEPDPRLVAAAWWRMGNAQEQLAQKNEARASYQKALQLDPNFEEAKKSLSQLK
ncbi:MAG: tetratricopeptide repeat protein [Acidobacteria bacterium]|nr:tetratricopeptide repeat protein [Acidobacteriota bacterium]